MEKTAVEWLYDNLKSHFEHDGDLLEVVQFSFEQAKEMEKQQIMNAVYDSMGTNFDANMGRAKLYYDTTFKQD
jgi:flagellar biosynthesis/type III secretory pathway chaperone